MEQVWKCICSANFKLTFASVMECITLDKMDYEYKMIEKDLTEAYSKKYDDLKNEMIKNKGPETTVGRNQEIDKDPQFRKYKTTLSEYISMHVIGALNERINVLVKGEGRDKWREQYKKKWDACLKDQAENWESNLKMSFTSIFNYGHHVENYKRIMRGRFNDLFRQLGPTEQTDAEKERSFQRIYKEILKAAEEEFPGLKVSDVIEEVYAKSNIIMQLPNDNRQNAETDRKICEEYIKSANIWIREDAESHRTSSKTAWMKRKLEDVWKYLTGSTDDKKLNDKVIVAFGSVYDVVNRIVVGKVCYDDSIISSVILKTNEIISPEMKGSEKQLIHTFGRTLITQFMKDIQEKWETVNSVSVKLKLRENETELHNYFELVSRGYKKTQLFARHMASVLKENLVEAFYQYIIRIMLREGITNKRWIYEARFMHKHLDLYLIDLLERDEVGKVLDYIRKPQELYRNVLAKLIAKKVPENVGELWTQFLPHLKTAITTAANVAKQMKRGKAEKFVAQLKTEMLDDHNIRSQWLAEKFSTNIGGEFKDCDDEEDDKFAEACIKELIGALQIQDSPTNQKNFIEVVTEKVTKHLESENNLSTRPRCTVCCRLCKSLCIKPANHDPENDKHDAIHQPGGIAGFHYTKIDTLSETTCNQDFEQDGTFYLDGNYSVPYKFRNFDKVFPGWENPRICQDLPLREYILANYNEVIASKYNLKPCTNIPPKYRSRKLEYIRQELERETAKYY